MNETKTAVVLASLEKKANPLFKKLPTTITTKQEYEDAASNMKLIKMLVKDGGVEKKILLDPLTEIIENTNILAKRIKDLFKPFEDKVEQKEDELKNLMLGYLIESKKQIAKISGDLSSGKIKKASTAVKKQNELQATSNIRKVWTAICEDENKTPREFMVPDEAAIKEALKGGKKVAGWTYKQIETIVI